MTEILFKVFNLRLNFHLSNVSLSKQTLVRLESWKYLRHDQKSEKIFKYLQIQIYN